MAFDQNALDSLRIERNNEPGSSGPSPLYKWIVIGVLVLAVAIGLYALLRDKAIEVGDRFCDATVIPADHLTHVLWITPRRERRRTDQIAKHHRKLTTLSIMTVRRGRTDRGSLRCRNGGSERRNRLQQSLPMSEHHPELLKIDVGPLGQDLGINGIVAKGHRVLLQF